MGIHSSLACCFGETPTKYHITIQKTITQTKATVKVVSENRSRFEKFAMPWNAAHNSKEWVSLTTLPIPHEAKSRTRKNGKTFRWVKSKCHRNHITSMGHGWLPTPHFIPALNDSIELNSGEETVIPDLLFSTLLFGWNTNKIPHNYPKDDDADKSHGESCVWKQVTFREIRNAMKCSA